MNAIRTTLVVGALISAACLAQFAQAQDRPPMGQGPGMGGSGMHGSGMSGHGMGPMCIMLGPPAILEATDKYVYVLRGDTLFQYSADGLKLLARAELPRPEPRDRPDGKAAPGK